VLRPRLPRQVTLPTGTQQRLPVTVRIPRSTRRGQYLAGITAELAKKPRPVVVGSSKKASAQAIIVQQVTVGIAVTVGPASALTSRLAISGVTGGLEGVTPRLSIHVANTGRTFLHGQGMVSWHVASAPLSAPVFVGTVLPGDDALIAVNAPRMPTGATTLVQVRIRYGPGLTARWSGMVTIPARPHLRLIHTGKGAYSVVPAGRTPVWAIAIIVVGILLLVVLALLTWLLVRSRRRHVPAHSKDRDIADRLDSYTRK
jgi:hypothetical protein